MNVAVAEFTRSILHKDDLSSATVAELEQLVNRYPYFVPARLLYLKKLTDSGADNLDTEMRRAEIWIPNTAWLDQLMFDTGKVLVVDDTMPLVEHGSGVQNGLAMDGGHVNVVVEDAVYGDVALEEEVDESVEEGVVDDVSGEDVDESLDEVVVNDFVEKDVDVDESVEDEVAVDEVVEEGVDVDDAVEEEFAVHDFAEKDVDDRLDDEVPGLTADHADPLADTRTDEPAFDPLTGLTNVVQEEADSNSFDEMNRYATEELPVNTTEAGVVLENTGQTATDNGVSGAIEEELLPGAAPEQTTGDPAPGNFDNASTEAPDVSQVDIEPGYDDEDGGPLEEEPPAPGEPAEFRIAPFREETMTAGQELTFEPFHTVDYFASQGIQARDEEKPADRFSEQLKSFTQWLKAMKKVPGTPAGIATVIREEKKIEEMAEHSVKGKDVLTEAMAEVWIKQGNPGNARAVYEKLSLLDPAKSAYFAAKIEQLKFL